MLGVAVELGQDGRTPNTSAWGSSSISESWLAMVRTRSRRSFLKTTTAMTLTPLTSLLPHTGAGKPDASLVAYVGTFSSPLRDTLPTQVDLPPGNGRGIHLFRVDRSSGA